MINMRKILRKPYVFWIIGIFIFYILLNVFISGFYKTIQLIFIYASEVNWLELGTSILLSIAIGALVAINAVYAFMKYKERKKCLEGKALAGIGAAGGLIVGVCPLCVTGLFPIILGFLGISFSFASLPFNGIEVQLIVIALLSISLWMLNRKSYR